MHYRGLTWDHPRGYNALRAAAHALDPVRDGLEIAWDKQPLEGFESHPIDDLAVRYDLIVLDHPHIGEAVEKHCLVPLDDVFTPEDISGWEKAVIGPCLSSYRYAGRNWALPLDAATQVMAARQDLPGADIPQSWEDVAALSERQPVALSIAGPHAILSFFSMAVAQGEPPASRDPEELLSQATGTLVLDLLARLCSRAPRETHALNPIGILNLMSTSDAAALCPLIYGYVNYAVSSGGARSISFHNAPLCGTGKRHGSTLGGTGIGVSRRCQVTPELISHLRWLMSEEAQKRFIPAHDGQPSLRAAWHDEEVNRQWNGFYRATVATLEDAWVRPRYSGYIAFQTDAAAIIRDGLAEGQKHKAILNALQERYAQSRKSGGEL